MDVREIVGLLHDIANGGEVPLLLAVIAVLLVGAFWRWWVPGPEYRRLERRSDVWVALAVRLLLSREDTEARAAVVELLRQLDRL